MNGGTESEQLLETWLREGPEAAPDRFVWAALDDVELTAQRGGMHTSLERLIMRVHPLASVLSAAGLLIAATAYVVLSGRMVGDPELAPVASMTGAISPTRGPRAYETPAPTPREIAAGDLSELVLTSSSSGWELVRTIRDPVQVLTLITRSPEGVTLAAQAADALVAGLANELSGGRGATYVSWATLFQTEAEAERVQSIYLAEFAASGGWDLAASSAAPLPTLSPNHGEVVPASSQTPEGIEGVLFQGTAEPTALGLAGTEPVPVQIAFWRRGNVLLALAALGDFDPVFLHDRGHRIEGRARAILNPTR